MSGVGSGSGRHLRLVRTEQDAARELAAYEARKVAHNIPECNGSTLVTETPSGDVLREGIFLLCIYRRTHKGPCRDATDITFKPDMHSLHTDKVVQGHVVNWNNFDDEQILDLERTLLGT